MNEKLTSRENRVIKRDRMRFTKNSLASGLVLVAILFNVFYFINIYKSDVTHSVGNFYYQYRIGVSIIYNLVFMLASGTGGLRGGGDRRIGQQGDG